MSEGGDPWWGVLTVHGLPADEVRSSLQKYVRRGRLEEAVLAAYELYCTSTEAEDLLWRRMEIMAAEDVGFGQRELPAIIEALHAQRSRLPRGGDRWILAVHAVRLLVTAVKDRTSAELAGWAEQVVAKGERGAEVLDVAVDMHTARGVAMHRGVEHFFAEGHVVSNELAGRDLTWLAYLQRQAAEGSANS